MGMARALVCGALAASVLSHAAALQLAAPSNSSAPAGGQAMRHDLEAVMKRAAETWNQHLAMVKRVDTQLEAHEAGLLTKVEPSDSRRDDLVFMHIPYNFGHTIEMVRAAPADLSWSVDRGGYHGGTSGGDVDIDPGLLEDMNKMARLAKPGYEPWGHFNPDLFAISNVTGCPLYYTPQKYWPEDLARSYFGNKTVFGVIRDPYERLVAQFRGDFRQYGGTSDEFVKTCDVNGAVKWMMAQALSTSNKFVGNCTYIPQADYFDGKYGVTLAVDNRRFPTSMNEVFAAHGYSENIRTENVMHVHGCDNVWAGDLDAEAKGLVRKVFARDFELLCSEFGYCDEDENTCLKEVEHMCPAKLFTWDASANHYVALNGSSRSSCLTWIAVVFLSIWWR